MPSLNEICKHLGVDDFDRWEDFYEVMRNRLEAGSDEARAEFCRELGVGYGDDWNAVKTAISAKLVEERGSGAQSVIDGVAKSLELENITSASDLVTAIQERQSTMIQGEVEETTAEPEPTAAPSEHTWVNVESYLASRDIKIRNTRRFTNKVSAGIRRLGLEQPRDEDGNLLQEAPVFVLEQVLETQRVVDDTVDEAAA